MDDKRCSKCKEIKPLEEFSPKPSSKDGRQSQCKKCKNARKPSTYAYVATKRCCRCKVTKNACDFDSDDRRKDGLESACKECMKDYARAYRPKEYILVMSKMCTKCKEEQPATEFNANARSRTGLHCHCKRCDRDTSYMRKYGITLAEYEHIYALQNGICAICDRELPLDVDHCHKNGKFRGLLCGKCNKGIGHFYDNPVLIRHAADYVETHGWQLRVLTPAM